MQVLPLVTLVVLAGGFGPEPLPDGGMDFRLPDAGFVEMQPHQEEHSCVADTAPLLAAIDAGRCRADADCEVLHLNMDVRGLELDYAVSRSANSSRRMDAALRALHERCGVTDWMGSRPQRVHCEGGKCRLGVGADGGSARTSPY